MGTSSSTAITMSVFLTLWIQGTCLSPMPSMRCAPKPLLSSVGHWSASLAASLLCGNSSFSRSPALMVPAEPVVKTEPRKRLAGAQLLLQHLGERAAR